MTVDAATKEEAAGKIKTGMTQAALDEHWKQNHSSDTNQKPTLEESHMHIDEGVYEDTGMAPAM